MKMDFQALADLIADNVGRHDANLRVIHYNKALLRTLDLTLDDVLGKTPSEIYPDGRYASYEAKLREAISTKREIFFDITVPGAPLGTEYHNIRITPTFDPSGEVMGVIAIGRDYTERVLLEQKLVSSSRLAALGEMAASVAHEINNPLAIISAKCQVLQRAVVANNLEPAKLERSLVEISETTARIGRIIRGLHTFARDGQGDPFTRVSLRTLLDDTLSVCSQRIKHGDVQLRYHAPDFDALATRCSLTRMSQVMVNLLNNSFDAVAGQPDAWILVEARERLGAIELSVTDSGPGIPLSQRGYLMQPFYTTKDPSKGLGLGLSVSNGIVRDHKGTLDLDGSSPNTRFVVTLPMTA